MAIPKELALILFAASSWYLLNQLVSALRFVLDFFGVTHDDSSDELRIAIRHRDLEGNNAIYWHREADRIYRDLLAGVPADQVVPPGNEFSHSEDLK